MRRGYSLISRHSIFIHSEGTIRGSNFLYSNPTPIRQNVRVRMNAKVSQLVKTDTIMRAPLILLHVCFVLHGSELYPFPPNLPEILL